MSRRSVKDNVDTAKVQDFQQRSLVLMRTNDIQALETYIKGLKL
jgi:hypothetical protein